MANDDDINTAAAHAASLFERRFEVEPKMLSLLCDERFERYGDVIQGIKDGMRKHEEIWHMIEVGSI
jgi:hypothetical protein